MATKTILFIKDQMSTQNEMASKTFLLIKGQTSIQNNNVLSQENSFIPEENKIETSDEKIFLANGNIVLLQPIGKGGFASVKKAYYVENSEDCAIKFLKKTNSVPFEVVQIEIKIAETLKMINHDNILKSMK